MVALANTGQHRVYALDFWGFGDSAKVTDTTDSSFQIDSYVEMVHQFMDSLGIIQAPLFGHSMGGTVALQTALTYPDRVEKVAVVGAPIVGKSLNPFLQLSGYGSIAKLVWRYPILLNSVMRIVLAKDSKKVRGMIFRDVQRATIESFFRSIGDLRNTDLRNQLPGLSMQTMGIFGAQDNIVSPDNANILKDGVKTADINMMPASRHFPMIDEPDHFLYAVNQFLNENYEARRNVAPV